MMFSDEEIKEKHLMRQGDEIISIKKVCLNDKNKRDLDEYHGPLSPLSARSTQEEPVFRDGFLPILDADTGFSWSEEDLAMVSLGSTQPSFGKDSDAAWKREMRGVNTVMPRKTKLKVDKSDPRSRLHYVKVVKRNGRTVKFWECGICGRDFLHQYTLMRHLPTHTDERNFRCEVCSKCFRQLSTLSQHRAIHSADRPYECEVCSKTFNRLSTLISHRKTHSGEKPYRCNICSKGFHQKGNLRNHTFTHTNERPYRCNICMTGFNQQSNLVCHKIKAHPDSSDLNVKTDSIPVVKVRSSSQLLEKFTAVNPPQNSEVSSSTFDFSSLDLSTSDSIDLNSEESLVEPTSVNGVMVDPINTFHMEVALAAKQTPFALIKSENGPPVLVKVLDVKFTQGKQMLVPATVEDLMYGGKIVYSKDDKKRDESPNSEALDMSAVQMRVPVVAVVVPKLSDGRLQLTVEEPHQAYPGSSADASAGDCSGDEVAQLGHQSKLSDGRLRLTVEAPHQAYPGSSPGPASWETKTETSSCCLLSSAPSPPLDISLELFDTMECMPMSSRLSPDNDIQPPHASVKSNNLIDIDELRESILLSDSE